MDIESGPGLQDCSKPTCSTAGAEKVNEEETSISHNIRVNTYI